MRATCLGTVVPFLVVGLAVAGPARADPVADFYHGKQISLVMGTTPGGGYDAYGRLVARFLGSHIPGRPDVIPKDMPGAGGLTMANYLYNQAPKDGTEIGEPQNGAVFEKLFQILSPGGKTALFDADKFGWIGSADQTVFVTVTWYTSPVKTLADAEVKEATLGATGPGTDNYLLAVLSNKIFGTKFKIVNGYDGASAVDLAIERGEVEGAAGKDWTTITATHPDWIRDKSINILVQMGLKPHPDLQGVPSALDLAPTPQDKEVLELVFAKYGMSRPFMAPPGVPPERLAALRAAFDETMADSSFLAEAEKEGMEIRPVSGPDVQALVSRILNASPDIAEMARSDLQP
jgi:tripartite-type tricarboxylate transporter receptor subunit TctC